MIDDEFVKSLKKRMIEDPSAPGVTPVALLVKSVTKDAFLVNLRNQYEYEVLGGGVAYSDGKEAAHGRDTRYMSHLITMYTIHTAFLIKF